MNRTRLWMVITSCLSLSLLLAVAGCGGGGGTLIALAPSSPVSLDAGQTLSITADVINDHTSQGASFALTGPGTLSTPQLTKQGETSVISLIYSAPSTIATNTSATLVAASVATSSQPSTLVSSSSATLIINLFPALVITTTSIPSGTVNNPYSVIFATSGGGGSLTWSLASGTLPAGLSLNSIGFLTGTPTASGTYNFTIAVLDGSAAQTPTLQSYTLTILPSVTTTTLPNAVAGSAYSQTLAYAGGNGTTPTWAITSGSLPAGLTLSSAGTISGTPTNAAAGANYPFSVTVTVSGATSPAVQLSITVPALPMVTTTSLPSGNIGVAYSRQLSYSGGAGGTVAWAITAGSLPAGSGLTFNTATGTISGTPTTATTYSFSVAVTVGPQTSAAQALTLTINSVNVTSPATATGELGLPFSFRLTAAGGKPPFTWSLATGSAALPAGLVLNATTGLITGTPTTTSGSPFGGIIVQATDTQSATATQSMTFTINPARSSALNSELNGSYAFLISGFDANGNPLAAAGSFTADGNGHITAGVMDINGTGTSTPTSNAGLTASTFSIGSDGRGKLTLTTASTSTTFVMAVSGVSGGVATTGSLSEFDGTGQSLTGTLAQQTTSAFSVASLTSSYAFGASGFASGSTASSLVHRALAGQLQLNGSATPSAMEYLASSAASSTPAVPTGLALSIGANGRGTLAWTPATGNVVHFVVYVVSPSRFFLLSSDPASGTTNVNDLYSGQALAQTGAGSFTSASLTGTSVVRLQSLGTTTAGTTFADALVGLYTFSGSGAISLSGDENAGGVSKSASLNGTYSVASNGRVSATLGSGFGGCLNCVGANQVFFYLVNTNQGFAMDFSAEAKAGSFDPQGTMSFANSALSGSYALGSQTPLSAAATSTAGSLNSTGSGTATATEDLNTAGVLSPDVPVTATYSIAASGRGTFTPASGNALVLYVISATQAVSLDLTTGSPVVVQWTH